MRDVTPKAHRCSLGACPAILEVTPQDLRCHVGESCPSLFEVTPEAMRCPYADCPAVFEVTPEPMQCEIGASCPALYEQQDGHIIIGKVMKEIPEEVAKRIGPDEFAVWVPRGLVKPGDDNRLRDALEPFAKIAKLLSAEDKREGWEPLDGREFLDCQELAERGVPGMILLGDLRRAQKALEDTVHGRGPVPEKVPPAEEVQSQPDEAGG